LFTAGNFALNIPQNLPYYMGRFVCVTGTIVFEREPMGLYDRDYTRANYRSQFHGAPQMHFGFPRITPVVKWLLIINVAVFFGGLAFFPDNIPVQIGGQTLLYSALEKWFAVFPTSLLSALQVWRLVTYQFLHGGTFHILFNMLGVFFLGPTLERHWGSRRFLTFYLGCGMAGGVFYTFLVAAGVLSAMPMIGASGAVLGLLVACAILFPHFVVILLFFPVPIRIAALLLCGVYLANLLSRGPNAGGDAAHLAGMAAGAAYVLSGSWREKMKRKLRSGSWEKKMAAQRDLRVEVDRILQKVHRQGIHSLTSKEKRILKKATEAEQRRNGPY
jgi:membrane associated rhomboid family serine protease